MTGDELWGDMKHGQQQHTPSREMIVSMVAFGHGRCGRRPAPAPHPGRVHSQKPHPAPHTCPLLHPLLNLIWFSLGWKLQPPPLLRA